MIQLKYVLLKNLTAPAVYERIEINLAYPSSETEDFKFLDEYLQEWLENSIPRAVK